MAIYYLIRILNALIFVRVILSWFPVNRNNPLIKFVYMMTEPVLGPLRNMLDKSPLGGAGMMLDFSPLLAIFVFEIILRVAAMFLLR
ncbi:MAG: YggT family protein [Firmicutes bacterium]|nr:YggT family protein [Bacillota bacterium]